MRTVEAPIWTPHVKRIVRDLGVPSRSQIGEGLCRRCCPGTYQRSNPRGLRGWHVRKERAAKDRNCLYDRPSRQVGGPSFFFLSRAGALAPAGYERATKVARSAKLRPAPKAQGRGGPTVNRRAQRVRQGWRVSATGGLFLTDREHDGTLVRKRR